MEKILQLEKIDYRIKWGFFIALSLALLCYILTLFNNKRLNEDQKMVEQTYEVLTMLSGTFSSIKDAESGARGYLLYKDSAFLKQYNRGVFLKDSLGNNLKAITYDNKDQQNRVIELLPLMNIRIKALEFIIQDFNKAAKKVTDSIMDLKDTQLGLMNLIRDKVKIIREEEYRLLKLRKEETKKSSNWLDRIIFFSLLFSVALAVFGFITYRKEHNARKKAYTRVQEYQDKLKQQVAELHLANLELVKMKSQEKFAATGRIARQIAHEVRNPLTNINLATDQLIEDLPDKSEDTVYLFDMIKRNSSRINDLIADLLKSTKFADLVYAEKNVNTIINEALAFAQDRIDLHKITVHTSLQENLPLLKLDEEKIKIALLNIIINAIEAMEHTSHPTLTITTNSKGNAVDITIADNGKGMDEETLSKLFEPYFTNKQKGNGLGLTNTQNIILNHKGDIGVTSSIDKGTIFTIKLTSV